MANIDIPSDVVAKYEPKDVLAFAVKNLKSLNKYVSDNNETVVVNPRMNLYISILEKLSEKMNGQAGPTVL